MCKCCSTKTSKNIWFYVIALSMGILCGFSGIDFLEQLGKYCSEVFIRIFKCISIPVVSLSVIVALAGYDSDKSMVKVWKKTLFYTITTTIAAASISAILYILISPANVAIASSENTNCTQIAADYSKYFLEIIPDNILRSFIDHKILSVLLISVIIGISIRAIKESDSRHSVVSFFKGFHSIFFTITRFIVKVLPIGLFGFVVVSISEFKNGTDLRGMGSYFLVIVLANLVQGLLVLPTWLAVKGINPIQTMKAMFPALSVAFFSKSSSAALPVTIETAETKLLIDPRISRFTLPLCTTINMNGCAAFIFTTVIYLMQNHGIEIEPSTILTWILIATIAAVGNAGVPMGCFFLSASLLSMMDIPMPLMGVILPFYGIVDMIETSLNVWSDSCVTAIVDKDLKSHE